MSESVNKNLGHATAYGYAKSKGFTGTEEEFAELMASYGTVAQSAAASASAAAQAKTDAEAALEAAEEAEAGAKEAERSVDSKALTVIQGIETAGEEQVTGIRQAGADQVDAVETAGGEQVDAVEQKGAEVRQSIPAEYTELSEDVTELKSAIDDIEDSLSDLTGGVVPVFTKGKYITWTDTDNMWTYTNGGSYACIESDNLIHLDPGDVIKMESYTGVLFSVFYHRDSDGKYVRSAGRTSDFEVTAAGDYAIATQYVPSQVLTDETFKALVDKFIITKSENLIADVNRLKTDMSAVKENLEPNGITPEQLQIVDTVNLYNVATNTNGYIINSNGSITENANYTYSAMIYLKPGTYWITYDHGAVWGFVSIAYYDINGNFKSRPQLASNTLTIENECYVRLIGAITHVANGMLVKGTEEPEEYVPYKMQVLSEYLPDMHDDGPVDGARIINETIGAEKVNFVTPSENNLINRMTMKYGKSMSAQGAISDTAGSNITDKMYLKPSTTYSYRDCYRIVYFNASDERVGSSALAERGSDYATGTFTTHASTVYAIAVVQVDTPSITRHWQIVEGETLPDFEVQHLIINGYRIYDEPDKPYDPIQAIRNWDRMAVDTAPLYLLDADVSALETSDRNVAAIYSKYDTLMAANSDYITRTELGDDGNGVTLYRYDFNTTLLNTGSSYAKTKMILISGIHPEWAGIYGLYHTMERITNDPKLIDVKANLHIIVVPVVNAYACNGNAARTNHNGVDLARNFEVGWGVDPIPTTETNPGPSALSEVEDQYIDQIMAANTDAIYFVSCHNFQRAEWEGTTLPYANMWANGCSRYWNNVGAKAISKMSAAWQEKYNYNVDTFGTTRLETLIGNEAAQALKYNIQGGVFEVSCFFNIAEDNVTYSASAISRGAEAYINLVRTAMYCFESQDKKRQIEAN